MLTLCQQDTLTTPCSTKSVQLIDCILLNLFLLLPKKERKEKNKNIMHYIGVHKHKLFITCLEGKWDFSKCISLIANF